MPLARAREAGARAQSSPLRPTPTPYGLWQSSTRAWDAGAYKGGSDPRQALPGAAHGAARVQRAGHDLGKRAVRGRGVCGGGGGVGGGCGRGVQVYLVTLTLKVGLNPLNLGFTPPSPGFTPPSKPWHEPRAGLGLAPRLKHEGGLPPKHLGEWGRVRGWGEG